MLAIVIPFYKITFFDATLNSLACQTDERFKVYIGDDASPENPTELLEKYKGLFDFFYNRFECNLGSTSLVKQWERCIALSNEEEWLMILGDDDFLSDNVVENFYSHKEEIEKLNINVVRFSSQVLSFTGEKSLVFNNPKIEKSTDSFYRKFILGSTRSSLSEYVFKKTSYEKYRFRNFPLGWGADNFAWLDFTNFGNIYSIDEANIFITISDKNISREGYKIEIKAGAKYSYFNLIIFQYIKRFSKEQRRGLLQNFEILTFNMKEVSFLYWVKMSLLYLSENEYIQFLKFQRRLILYKFGKTVYNQT